jgi:hypothetical protein
MQSAGAARTDGRRGEYPVERTREGSVPQGHVHFNGSVNLADAETVMREIAARVPSGLRRIPDGETGAYAQRPRLRLADGVDPATVIWPDLGYADAYLESYPVFARLREEGVIPSGVRFQVEYPTPLASINGYIVPEQQQILLGSYERAMFADLGRLLAAIPGDDVAVQWDVAADSPGGRREWGISTECGMGRAGREEIPALLDLHLEILAARLPGSPAPRCEA